MAPLLARLDSHDRALYQFFLLAQDAHRPSRLWWKSLTHLGGATCTVAVILLPLLFGEGTVHQAAFVGAWALALSHVLVQIGKRHAVRPRPSAREALHWHVVAPDRFSFPSGHACASMAVAGAYSATWPSLSVPLLALAALVGFSRVRLGVHYPGDVIAGQAIALLTVFMVQAWV